jgi:hypothetical protein
VVGEGHRVHGTRRGRWSALALASALALSTAAGAEPSRETPLDYDAFIESLRRPGDERVDRERLARLVFRIAANLDGGKSLLRLLQARAAVPAPTRTTARTLLEAGFDDYVEALATFQASASRLMDDPTSPVRFYDALMDGQRACWHLDLHARMLDTYGVTESDMLSALSSLEACARFRTAVFQPRVAAVLESALAEPGRLRQRIRELEQEVRELESLVDDLRRIDAGE